jgi:hypothetical protein
VNAALDLLAGLVMEDGRRWGEVAYPWPWADAAAVLDPEPHAPRRFWDQRARGMSKTDDAAGDGLCTLVADAPPRSRSFAYAGDQDQARLILDSIAGFTERTPGLADLVEVGARTVTCRATGATLSVESSDSASAFDTRPYFTVVDEVAQWPDTSNFGRLWSAIVSATGKVAGSRLLVLSSAGSPSHPAFKRWTVAQESPHWRTSNVPGPSPWWSDADIEAAREQLLPAEFRRLILNEWAEADDSLATVDDVAACVGSFTVLEPRRGARYVMALDVGTRRDATALAVTHLEPSPTGRRVVVDRVMRWTGSRLHPVSLSDVETALLAVWRNYGRPKLIYDRMQAEQLTERLRHAGVRCDEFVFSSAGVNRLARSLFGALRDRAILLPADDELVAELSAVRLVETGPGLVRLDHKSGQHDDMAVVCAMCTASFMDRPTGGARILTADHLRVPSLRLTPSREAAAETGPPVVSERGERPLPPLQYRRRVGRFVVDDRRYQKPGTWR